MTASTIAVTSIPPFYCPIPPAVFPDADGLSARSVEWMRAFGLYADDAHRSALADSKIGRLVALTAPRGVPARMQAVSDLNVWYHALDDYYGDADMGGQSLAEVSDLVARLVHELEGPVARRGAGPGLASAFGRTPLPAQERFVLALRDLRARLAAFATPQQLADLQRGLQTYLLYELWERVNGHFGRAPDLEQYTVYCISGRAARPSMVMLPPVGGYEVPPHEARSDTLTALTQMACLIACWDNDIYSYPKEARQSGHHHNLLKVLGRRAGSDPLDTLGEAMAMRDRVMTRFLSLREQSLAQLSPGGARYVADLGSWVRGQLDWGTDPDNVRFAHPAFAVAMPAAFAARPADESPDPLPIRAIAWWWPPQAP